MFVLLNLSMRVRDYNLAMPLIKEDQRRLLRLNWIAEPEAQLFNTGRGMALQYQKNTDYF